MSHSLPIILQASVNSPNIRVLQPSEKSIVECQARFINQSAQDICIHPEFISVDCFDRNGKSLHFEGPNANHYYPMSKNDLVRIKPQEAGGISIQCQILLHEDVFFMVYESICGMSSSFRLINGQEFYIQLNYENDRPIFWTRPNPRFEHPLEPEIEMWVGSITSNMVRLELSDRGFDQ